MGIIDVYPTDEVYSDDTLTRPFKTEHFDRIMKTVEMRCVANVDGKCTIYEKRPAICRAFQVGSSCCENIRHGYLNSHTCEFCVVSDALKKSGVING
jgi:Fe-S-cluster containining protein